MLIENVKELSFMIDHVQCTFSLTKLNEIWNNYLII